MGKSKSFESDSSLAENSISMIFHRCSSMINMSASVLLSLMDVRHLDELFECCHANVLNLLSNDQSSREDFHRCDRRENRLNSKSSERYFSISTIDFVRRSRRSILRIEKSKFAFVFLPNEKRRFLPSLSTLNCFVFVFSSPLIDDDSKAKSYFRLRDIFWK